MTDENDLRPLDEDVRAVVARASAIDVAPADAKARVLARVEATVGPPGGGGGARAGRNAEVRTPSPAATVLVRRLFPLVASFILGAGVGAFAMYRTQSTAQSMVTPKAAYVERPSRPETDRAAPAASAPPEPAALKAAEPPMSATAAAPKRSLAAPANLQAPAAPAAPANQLVAERELLDKARGALQREDPDLALNATAEHARRYPGGILAQEREAIAIRALAGLGRVEEARARAERYRLQFPGSVLAPTLEATLRARSDR